MGGGALIDQAFKRLRMYVYVFEMLLLSKKEMVLLLFVYREAHRGLDRRDDEAAGDTR